MSKTKSEPKVSGKVLSIILLCLVLGFALFITIIETQLNSGEEVLLKTQPVDPRDVLRGDYVILNYDIENGDDIISFLEANELEVGDTVYLVLQKNRLNYGVVQYVTLEKPVDRLFLRATIERVNSRVDIGIDKYFIPEGRGSEVERLRGELDVLVSIDASGNPLIKDLYHNGQKFEFD